MKKTNKWLIPLIVGIAVFICILFVVAIIFIIKISMDSVASNFQGAWECSNLVNIDIGSDTFKMYTSSNKLNKKYGYKFKGFDITNGHHTYNITTTTPYVTNYLIEMDSTDMGRMILTNMDTNDVYNCRKK